MIGNLFKLRLAKERRAGPSFGSWLTWEVRGKAAKAVLCFPRTAWVQKIKAASEQYIDTEKKKREKAYQGSRACPGRLEPDTGALGSGVEVLTFRTQLQQRGVDGE